MRHQHWAFTLETSLRYTFLLRCERDGLEAAEVALEAA